MDKSVFSPGGALRRRREALGLSIRRTAKGAGVSYALIGALERDEVDLRKSRTATIYGLLQVLVWTPEEFAAATGIRLPGGTVDHTRKVKIFMAKELKIFQAVSGDLERLEEFTGGDLLKHIRIARKSIKRLLEIISREALV